MWPSKRTWKLFIERVDWDTSSVNESMETPKILYWVVGTILRTCKATRYFCLKALVSRTLNCCCDRKYSKQCETCFVPRSLFKKAWNVVSTQSQRISLQYNLFQRFLWLSFNPGLFPPTTQHTSECLFHGLATLTNK